VLTAAPGAEAEAPGPAAAAAALPDGEAEAAAVGAGEAEVLDDGELLAAPGAGEVLELDEGGGVVALDPELVLGVGGDVGDSPLPQAARAMVAATPARAMPCRGLIILMLLS